MKLNLLLHLTGIIILISLINSCSYKTLPTTETFPATEVNFLSGKEGTITLRSVGTGINIEDAINSAEKNAINVLLFRGIPGSEQKTALIGINETEEINIHKEYFTRLYGEDRYKTFVMSSIPSTELIKYKAGKKSITVDIKINLVALRTDLEQNKIIRKFGF